MSVSYAHGLSYAVSIFIFDFSKIVYNFRQVIGTSPHSHAVTFAKVQMLQAMKSSHQSLPLLLSSMPALLHFPLVKRPDDKPADSTTHATIQIALALS